MQLTLDTLKETGAFTGRPVEKEIKWKGRDGKEHIATVYVRPMGYHTTKAELLAYNGKSDPIAERIAAHICDQDGAPVFTAADILGTATPDRGRWTVRLLWPSGCNSRCKRTGKDYELTGEDEFWCELVMNGIGGRTIAEAQERMSRREFLVWLKYREKYGPLNIMMRTEWGLRWWRLSG